MAEDLPDTLRVAFDGTPLLSRPTGVGVFCRGALAALVGQAGLDVVTYQVTWRARADRPDNVGPTRSSRQLPMPATPLHTLWRWTDFPTFEMLAGAADVVHGTNFVAPPTRRAREVVTVHDLTPVRYPALCDRATRAFPALLGRAIRRGAWVHAVSEFVADEVMDVYGIDRARVRVVYHGVPPSPRVGEEDAGPLTCSIVPADSPFVLSVATAEPRKDLPGLVRAFDNLAERHHDLRLVLAGPEGWGEESLRAAIDAARHRGRIVRTGWVPERTLAALFRRARLLAYPSVYEGFGFPPLQAMDSGVPVVTTRAGAIPEIVGDAALLVDVGAEGDLAKAMDTVLTDDHVRNELIAAGTRRATAYSWDSCAKGLASLYHQAAGA